METAEKTPNKSEVLESFRILENVIFLKKAPLFAAVEAIDLKNIALIAEESPYEAGSEIVREGDVGDAMYIIKEGTVAISKKAVSGPQIELAQLSRGDCFGDMAVLDTEVRSASVFAKGTCTLLCIKRDDLMDVITEFPSIAVSLLVTFAKRLRKANTAIENLSNKVPTDGQHKVEGK